MATLMATAAAAVKAASLGTILSAAGGIVSTVGALAQGSAAKASSEYEAKQLEAQGLAENAAAQREAQEERRQKEIMMSRARAVGAASGGGLDFELAGDIEEEGEYRALTALWEGEEAAKGRKAQAEAARFDGKQAKKASLFKAGKTLLGTGTSIYEKYA